jgi:hypothetical protein
MPTLIVASPPFVALSGGTPPRYAQFDHLLADAATAAGWGVVKCHGDTLPEAVDDPALYVTTELALEAGRRLNLALLEPPFDLLARIPERFRRRAVEFATFGDLVRLRKPTFVKPADPLDKWFDAGVYSQVRDIRTKGQDRPDAPVLLSEPVEWSAEYRYFVLDGKAVAGSPYLSFGRPAWRLWTAQHPATMPTAGLPVVEALCATMRGQLPPAFVVDVGVIEDRGWAVVEFNPAWSAGLLGAEPRAVLPVLRRVTRRRDALDESDARWVVDRTAG